MRRVTALLALLALVAASCGGESGDLQSDGQGSSDTMLLVPDDDSPSGSPRGDGDGGASRDVGDGGAVPPGDGAGGDGGGGSGGGGSDGGSTPAIDDQGRVGSMGQALLSSEVPEAAVEIDASPQQSLTSQARSALVRHLENHGQKLSVALATGSELPDQDVWTTSELRALMQSNRSTWSTGQRAGVYVMVLSGRHENANVVGVSFNASSFAVFPEQLGGGLLGLNYPAYEEAVVVHELGHLFGLVNLTGQGAFHEDPENEGHSANGASVMYWAVESTLVTEIFEGGPPREFDADDVSEMDAIRG